MKKTIPILALICLFGCTKNDAEKEGYLSDKLPFLSENLSATELALFKESMEFNQENALISWNMTLLEKGSKERFDSVMVNISSEMGGNIDNIVIIDTLGNERKIDASRFRVNSLNGKAYILNDFNSPKTVFLITSTTCGYCVQFFEKANKLADDPRFLNVNFVALFGNSQETIDRYKTGTVIKNFGFLNKKWIAFSKDSNVIQGLKLDFVEREEGYPVLFYKKNGKLVKTNQIDQMEEILINLNI